MGAISALQQQVQSLQAELNAVRAEILKYKYRETGANIISPHATLLGSGAVSVAVPPPVSPPPPPPVGTSSMYTPTSSAATDYSSISNENVPFFG